MLAAIRSRYGGPDVIELRTVDVPRPEAGQVLVQVRAASVNRIDHYELRGSPFMSRLVGGLRRPKEPGLGHDFAGDVVAVAADVSEPRVGDAVFGSGIRAFAEYVAVKAEGVVAKPPSVSYEHAAAVPVAGLTALQGLRKQADLRPGQRVLVTGAGGGVGGFAVRIAKALGAEVTATTRRWSLERVAAMGADRVFDSAGRGADADALAEPHRYDVVLDVAGDRPMAALARATRPNGVIVIIGAWRVSTARVLGWFLEQGVLSRIRGRRIVFFYSQRDHADLETLRDLLAAGSITPDIERTYPLDRIADAVRHLETFRTQGKVVVAPVSTNQATDRRDPQSRPEAGDGGEMDNQRAYARLAMTYPHDRIADASATSTPSEREDEVIDEPMPASPATRRRASQSWPELIGRAEIDNQRAYARLAGLMYLVVLGTSITGLIATSSVGAGLGFAQRSAAIAASESLVRLGLTVALVGSLSTVALAVALYVAVRPVDGSLALVGLLFRVCEAAIGGIGIALSFGVLQLRTAAAAGEGFAPEAWQALFGVLDGVATTEVAAIFFSLGSTVFFYLLLRSSYIPRAIATVGVVGSVVYAALWITRLAGSDVTWLVPYASVPILIAEVAGGLWLLLRGIDVPTPDMVRRVAVGS